ncbi:hypothetical protein GCM10028822_14600 [Hymenobacter terrigena]
MRQKGEAAKGGQQQRKAGYAALKYIHYRGNLFDLKGCQRQALPTNAEADGSAKERPGRLSGYRPGPPRYFVLTKRRYS